MFAENKYLKIYNNFISDRRIRKKIKIDFYESHYIIPKSIGGSDDDENLVELTPREHYFAHLLLTRITVGNDKNKMAYALSMMSSIPKTSKKIINSKQYELFKSIVYKILQIVGKEYKEEKTLQANILTEYTDFNKVFERGVCNICGIKPKAVNYKKDQKIFYRSKCNLCITGKNNFKIPTWKKDGYRKSTGCAICGFNAKFSEQLTVISEKNKYKTICLNCQIELKLRAKAEISKPVADF